jgi:hypothetical protein
MTAGNASCSRIRSPSDAGVPARRIVARAVVVLALALSGPGGAAIAGQFRYCDPPSELDATQQDTLFRFAAIVRETLDASGASVGLVARSGLELGRFGMRYSHAGIGLRQSPNTPWSVRQLYYDCGERRPRLFDEGLAGFMVGTADPSRGFFSVVLVPGAEATLERAALDNRMALRLLAGTYSANAYAFGTDYQNCNQWVAELLGVAWGGLADGPTLRADAQRWLAGQGYEPARFEIGNPMLMWLTTVLPWLHVRDHPPGDLEAGRFRVSMPQSIEAFARSRVPGARRIEFCHANRRVVVREGWTPIDDGCVPRPGDRVVELDG